MRKRFWLILLACVLLLLAVVFLFIRKNSTVESLYRNEVFAINTGFVTTLNQDSLNENLYFFTGTNIAKFNKQQLSEKSQQSSKSVWGLDIPFDSVSRVVGNEKYQYIYASVTSKNPYFDKVSGIPSSSYNQNGFTWFLVKDGNLAKPGSLEKEASDIFFENNNFYIISRRPDGSKQLLRFNPSFGKSSSIANDIQGTTIVGVIDQTVYTREYSGRVWGIDVTTGKSSSITDRSGSAWVDKQSGSVVYTDIDKAEATSEGGIIGDKRRVEVENSKSTWSSEVEGRIFISNGYLIVLKESEQKPIGITLFELSSGTQHNITIHEERKTRIKELVLVKSDFSVLLAITANNQLVPYLVKQEERSPFKYPRFSNNMAHYFSYSVARNTLTIHQYNEKLTRLNFEKSISIAEDSCTCDINQMRKIWSIDSPEKTRPMPEGTFE